MPRAYVHTLTIPYVVKSLCECAPDDSVTGDYNKQLNFVGNLINKTGNRIPESRADSIKLYKAITTVINASPSEFTQNMESFRRYIYQWASSQQGHKSLTDGSQLSLKANFVEYITYGLKNQHIVDIKEFGERVLQFCERRKHSRSGSPPSKRHRSDNRGKQRHSPPSSRGDKVAPDDSADTRLSTTTTRPHHMLCYRCG